MKKIIGFGAIVATMVLLANQHPASAQTPPLSGGSVDAAIIDDLVIANRILADQNVLDGFGHISVRHPNNSDRYLMRGLLPQRWSQPPTSWNTI